MTKSIYTFSLDEDTASLLEIQAIKDFLNRKEEEIRKKMKSDKSQWTSYEEPKYETSEYSDLKDTALKSFISYPEKEFLKYKKNKEVDNVNHPSHYTWLKELCGIEVLDITRHLDFDTGNAIKYLLRAGRKDPKKTIEDLEKAIFYIKDKINMLKNENK